MMTAMVVTVAAFCFTGNLQAACTNASDPLANLNNTSWAFQTQDDNSSQGDAAIGIFSAFEQGAFGAASPFARGQLSVTQTFNNSGFVERRLTSGGSYTVNSDCSGGTISFSNNYISYQYNFVFANSGQQMFLVNSGNDSGGSSGISHTGNHGVAYLLAATPSCSVLGTSDPTSILAPMGQTSASWSYLTYDSSDAENGVFTTFAVLPSPVNPFARGILTGKENISSTTTQTQGLDFSGSYTIYSDCSGGTLSFSGNMSSIQYDFVFAGLSDAAGFPRRMLLVSSNPSLSGFTGGVFKANRGQALRTQ